MLSLHLRDQAWHALLAGGLLAALALQLSGCGGGGDIDAPAIPDNAPSCPKNATMMRALSTACCDSSGNLLSPMPVEKSDLCADVSTADSSAVQGALVSGAKMGSSVAANLEQAEKLTSNMGGNRTGGLTSAATAGDTPGILQPGAPVPREELKIPTLLNEKSKSGGGGPSGPAANNGGGFLSEPPSITKANLGGGADAAAGGGPGAAGTDSAYATAGGGRGGQPGGGGLNWASMGTGAGGFPSGTESFGSGKSVDPFGTPDPEDYFTRLGLGDSLFKIVEKRYRSKAGAWARPVSTTSLK